MKASGFVARLCVLLFIGSVAKSQVYGAQPCDAKFTYENRNMTDYGVKVGDVKGTVVDVTNVPLLKACIALFNSDHSKLLRTVETDEEGRFVVDRVPPGKYWLVVKDQQRAFCPMAARLEVGRWLGKRSVAVHMKLGGIDTCSFCEAR